MCGRFTASFEFREIKLLFNLQRDIPLLSPRYNIAPSQEVPVIVQNDRVNELKPVGLVPSWSPDRLIGNHMINARAETITDIPSYPRLLESRRCLIPADGFMNRAWVKRHKQPNRSRLENTIGQRYHFGRKCKV